MSRFSLLDGYIAVAGTHGSRRKAEWTDPSSKHSAYLRSFGLTNVAGIAVPYNWSTDLDLGRGHDDWRAGGQSLFYYAAALPTLVREDLRESLTKLRGMAPSIMPFHRGGLRPSQTKIISHSHGRQVVLYAAKLGLQIDVWIDVSGPVRDDMDAVQEAAMLNIRRAVHVYSDHTDFTQILGELFGVKKFKRADDNPDVENVQVKGVGHSGLFTDEQHFHFWQDRGLVDALKEK